VLLLAGYVQAAHICASPAAALQHSLLNNADGGSARMPCLVCISLHAPSLAAPMVSVLSGGDSSAAIVVLQPVSQLCAHGFALYVRPPPAA
jgi:hypothetical protein